MHDPNHLFILHYIIITFSLIFKSKGGGRQKYVKAKFIYQQTKKPNNERHVIYLERIFSRLKNTMEKSCIKTKCKYSMPTRI